MDEHSNDRIKVESFTNNRVVLYFVVVVVAYKQQALESRAPGMQCNMHPRLLWCIVRDS